MKKRLLTIILCGLITASFAACGDTGTAEKVEEAPAEITTAAETKAADENTADAPQIRGGNAETTKAEETTTTTTADENAAPPVGSRKYTASQFESASDLGTEAAKLTGDPEIMGFKIKQGVTMNDLVKHGFVTGLDLTEPLPAHKKSLGGYDMRCGNGDYDIYISVQPANVTDEDVPLGEVPIARFEIITYTDEELEGKTPVAADYSLPGGIKFGDDMMDVYNAHKAPTTSYIEENFSPTDARNSLSAYFDYKMEGTDINVYLQFDLAEFKLYNVEFDLEPSIL